MCSMQAGHNHLENTDVKMVTYRIFFLVLTTGITANLCCQKENKLIQSCCDLNHFHFSTKPSGIYQTQLLCGQHTINTFCETGGWTVIQRRIDGTENFDRPWRDYENGFGKIDGEFWYGLKAMNCLTHTDLWELRVDFEFFNSTRSYLHYNTFKVGSSSEEYQLTIDGFTGATPTDPFTLGRPLSGRKFTTFDNDNDAISTTNCAARIGTNLGNGGWWYNNCWFINLNAPYYPKEGAFLNFAGTWYNPRWVEMKIRPHNCLLEALI